MIIDIVIGAIIILFMILGYRSGFVRSFLHMVGWLLATVLAFVWFPQLKTFLLDKTDFYDSIYCTVYEKASASIPDAKEMFANLPSIIGSGYVRFTSNITAASAAALADLIFTIISFIAVILVIRLVILLLSMALSKKNHDGFPGFFDGFLGCFFGLIKGVLIVFLILAFVVPLIGFSSPEHAQLIMDEISKSNLTLTLYDNNLLLLIVRDFMI